ncbi:MAG: glutamine amidotransferase [Myxococcales bacterium]
MNRLLDLFNVRATGADSAAAEYNDWHFTIGARLPHGVVTLLIVGAAVALLLSAATVFRSRRRNAVPVLLLRTAALAASLMVALQPTLELRQIVRVPNRVAVLVDGSRSMDVRPPDGGPSRAERAAALLAGPGSTRARWERDGHRVDLYTFGEGLVSSSLDGLRAPPAADATRIGEALAELGARYAGHDLGAVVLLSDGIDTGRIGHGPLDAQTRSVIDNLGAPIHAVAVGEKALRDLSVAAVMADEFAFVRTPVTIEALVRQNGLPDRQIDVTVTRDGRPMATRAVVLRGGSSEEKISFDWVPDHPGTFVFQIATPVLAGEALASNNAQLFTVKVIRDRIRVLHVCGRPSWDERFLRAMLRRDPNVDLVSFFILRTETDEQPWNRNELSLIPFPTYEIFEDQLHSFDLVIFQNFNYAPYGVEPYLAGIREYVEQGGAFAMIGGDLSFGAGGYAQTPLQEILPVDVPTARSEAAAAALAAAMSGDAFKPKLTNEGKGHPITSLLLDARENEARWGKLPALEGLNTVQRLRPGAVPLLVHPTARVEGGKPAPLLAVTEPGKGRSLALMTDTAWHWGMVAAGEGDDGRAFQRFWENAIRWLVRDPALTLLHIDLDRAEYRRHQSPSVRVRAVHPDYTPARGVSVALTVTSVDTGAGATGSGAPRTAAHPAGAATRQQEVVTDAQGESHVDIGALPAGAYRLSGRATLDGRAVTEDKTFVVRAEGKELEDIISREDVLREIAEAGGGTFQRDTLDSVTIRNPREVRVGSQKQLQVWSHPALLMLVLGLLAAEWAVRRRAGYS